MSEDKPTNSVLEVKLDYIQKDINTIKGDIKEIKSDYISRREFDSRMTELESKIAPLTKFVYAIISVIGISVLGAVLNLVINK